MEVMRFDKCLTSPGVKTTDDKHFPTDSLVPNVEQRNVTIFQFPFCLHRDTGIVPYVSFSSSLAAEHPQIVQTSGSQTDLLLLLSIGQTRPSVSLKEQAVHLGG